MYLPLHLKVLMKYGLWIILLLTNMATAVSAETYYVAADGSDENSGNKNRPLQF